MELADHHAKSHFDHAQVHGYRSALFEWREFGDDVYVGRGGHDLQLASSRLVSLVYRRTHDVVVDHYCLIVDIGFVAALE